MTKTLRNVAARNAHVLGGVTRSVKEVSGSVEKVFEEAADAVEEFLQRCEFSSSNEAMIVRGVSVTDGMCLRWDC